MAEIINKSRLDELANLNALGASGVSIRQGGEWMDIMDNSPVPDTKVDWPQEKIVSCQEVDRCVRDEIYDQARKLALEARAHGDTRSPQELFDESVDFVVALHNARVETTKADEAARKLTGRKDAAELRAEEIRQRKDEANKLIREKLRSSPLSNAGLMGDINKERNMARLEAELHKQSIMSKAANLLGGRNK